MKQRSWATLGLLNNAVDEHGGVTPPLMSLAALNATTKANRHESYRTKRASYLSFLLFVSIIFVPRSLASLNILTCVYIYKKAISPEQ
jgi:hypothetical protein